MSSSTNACPECGAAIATEDINIAQGVGLCRGCGKLSQLADIAQAIAPQQPSDAGPPPSGCKIVDRGGGTEIVVTASMRSVPGAAFTLVFATFWNGIVSVFLTLLIAGLWANLIGPVPSWMPAPNSNGKPMGLGECLFLALFLTPFVLVGTGMLLAAAVFIAGSVVVTIRGDAGTASVGVGPLRWRRKFDAASVKRVVVGSAGWSQNNQPQKAVCIETRDKTVKIGSQLSEQRRAWLAAVLQQLLVFKGK